MCSVMGSMHKRYTVCNLIHLKATDIKFTVVNNSDYPVKLCSGGKQYSRQLFDLLVLFYPHDQLCQAI